MTTQSVHLQITIPLVVLEKLESIAKASHRTLDEVVAESVDAVVPSRIVGLPADLFGELLGMMRYSDAALQSALQPVITLVEDRRLRELTHISKDRDLTETETEEQKQLLIKSQHSIIRRAQALAILKERGFSAFHQEDFENKLELG